MTRKCPIGIKVISKCEKVEYFDQIIKVSNQASNLKRKQHSKVLVEGGWMINDQL
jgi:hypothetical protein